MQELWKLNIGWDEAVPQALYETWTNYYSSLLSLRHIRISRIDIIATNHSPYMDLVMLPKRCSAYGACNYSIFETKHGERKAYPVCSKTRVAPLKIISLPKLELCAALLLTKLAVNEPMEHQMQDIHLWSDSNIVLCWIDIPPHKLKNYFANRVTEINNLVPEAKWYHVPSAQNPADALSRGNSQGVVQQRSLLEWPTVASI